MPYFATESCPGNGGAEPLCTEVIAGFGAVRDAAERRLAADGVVLPLPQTAAWLRAVDYHDCALIISVGSSGRVGGALSVGIGRARSLPGHRIYRVQRVESCADAATEAALLEKLGELARRDPLCLRVHVELFERNEERRARLGAALRRLEFAKATTPEAYIRTPSLELGASEQDLFAKCTSSARRNVRAPEKRGFHLVPLEDTAFADRLQSLMDEVFGRTGGTTRYLPWSKILEISRVAPHRSRVVGLFPPGASDPAELLAFAWGCVNGSYVTYEAGAATRNHGLGNMPLAYAPLWDLIVWAKRGGAAWFDFGGVSSPVGSNSSEDPLGGISDFKRFFCERVIEGGEDWILEPRPFRALLARAVRAAAGARGSHRTRLRTVLG